MRGRPRKPDALKILGGTFRPSRDGDTAEGVPAEGVPTKPRDRSEEFYRAWDSIVPWLVSVGVAKQADTHAVVGMVDALVERERVSSKMRESDVSSDGYYRLSVLHSIKAKEFERWTAKFGLTPSDRARLRIEKPKKVGVAHRSRIG